MKPLIKNFSKSYLSLLNVYKIIWTHTIKQSRRPFCEINQLPRYSELIVIKYCLFLFSCRFKYRIFLNCIVEK